MTGSGWASTVANSSDTTVGEKNKKIDTQKAETVSRSAMLRRLMTAESHGGRLRHAWLDASLRHTAVGFAAAAAAATPAAAICFGGANFPMKRHKS